MDTQRDITPPSPPSDLVVVGDTAVVGVVVGDNPQPPKRPEGHPPLWDQLQVANVLACYVLADKGEELLFPFGYPAPPTVGRWARACVHCGRACLRTGSPATGQEGTPPPSWPQGGRVAETPGPPLTNFVNQKGWVDILRTLWCRVNGRHRAVEYVSWPIKQEAGSINEHRWLCQACEGSLVAEGAKRYTEWEPLMRGRGARPCAEGEVILKDGDGEVGL